MAWWTALAAACATTLLLAGSATANPGTDKARLDARIGDLKTRANLAAGTAGVLTTELSGITSRVRSAESAVAIERARLAQLETALAQERARLTSLQQKIADETGRLGLLQRQYTTSLALLEHRVRDMYEAGTPDLISFALGTRSFSDLLDNFDLLNRIGRQDERIASSLDRSRQAVAQSRATTERARQGAARSEALIAVRTDAQRAARDRMLASRDALAAAQQAKARTLAGVREDRASFLAEAEGLAAQSAALAATIAAAEKASASSPANGSAPPPSNGQLGWPVVGPVTSGFGIRWGRMHEGIDIGVGSGTPVHAAAAGTVVYAGWMSGYGNIVVLDHGNGLSTAYAHNTSLIVGLGARVGKGFVIALSGSTGHSTGPHVHFEVRVNGAPVDPLGYL